MPVVRPRPSRPLRTGQATVAAALLLAAAVAARAAPGAGAGADPRAALPTRSTAHITVAGADLAPLDGQPLSALTLLADLGAGLEPVPFQIDERDPAGEWVLTAGLEAGQDADGGRLDGNDELVFMAADAGRRAPSLPPWTRAAVELEVVDPRRGDVGWAYLVQADGEPPRSPRAYVRLDPQTDSIEATPYELTFSRAVPISWAFFTLKGPDGAPGPNLVDRIKVRARATLLFGLVEWSVSEADFRAKPIGYLAGPIRVRRRVENIIEFGMGMESPEFYFDMVHYRDSILLPSKVLIPFELGVLVTDNIISAYIDFRDLDGWALLSPAADGPARVDGRMDDFERGLGGPPVDRLVLWNEALDLALLSRITLPESFAGVESHLHYVDDRSALDPPEDHPGQGPGIGFDLTHFETVSTGMHPVAVEIHRIPSYRPGDEDELLADLAQPLAVTTRGVGP